MSRASDLILRSNELFSSEERQNNENMWSELSEFMLNNQYLFNNIEAATQTDISNLVGQARGSKKTKRLFDSTALQSVQDLSSAFQGTLTNPATTWSKLRFQTEELNNDPESVIWLEEVNRIMHNLFNESNFDTEISKGYQSLVALANMAVFVEEKRDEKSGDFEGFRFTSLHLGQVAWAENKDNIVDTIFRKFSMTAKQAYEKWGDKVGHEILKALEKTPNKDFSFQHCIFPREESEIKLNELGLAPGKNRPVASVYLNMTSGDIMEETGFYEMPVLIARWGLLSGERYGRGPSHLALPDVRTLNRVVQRGLEAIDLQIRPPLLANQRDVFGSLDMRPGSINIVKDRNGVGEFPSQARTDVLQFSMEELRTSIKKMFFLDKIQPLNTLEKKERMTQFEVTKRLEEMQAVLGPVVSRLNSELLQPLVIRAFKLLLRGQVLPEIPNRLKELGINIEIVFVNQLARAQQIQDISNIQQWVQNIGALAQIAPEVVDNIDADGIAKHSAKILGVPEVAVRNAQEIEELRQQRAQAQQQEIQLQQANLAADTAAKAGMTGNTEGQ